MDYCGHAVGGLLSIPAGACLSYLDICNGFLCDDAEAVALRVVT